MTDPAYMEADHIRDLAQQYCDEHPGVSEEEARRRILVQHGERTGG